MTGVGAGKPEGFIIELHPLSRQARAITAGSLGNMAYPFVQVVAGLIQSLRRVGQFSRKAVPPCNFGGQALAGALFGRRRSFGTAAFLFGPCRLHGGYPGIAFLFRHILPVEVSGKKRQYPQQYGQGIVGKAEQPAKEFHSLPPAPSPL